MRLREILTEFIETEIRVKTVPNSGEYGEMKLQAFRDGKEVAYAFVVITGEKGMITRKDVVEVVDVRVLPEARRQGVATAMYGKIESMGYLIDPHGSQSPDGKAFWSSRRR